MEAPMTTLLPASIRPYAGKITDTDSHESIPASLWVEEFGEATAPYARFILTTSIASSGRMESGGGAAIVSDTLKINDENVWKVKGAAAPGAIDMKKRMEVLRFMQIDRQLIFPGGLGAGGMMLYGGAQFYKRQQFHEGDLKTLARILIDANNDWCLRNAKVSDRLRMVAILLAETPGELLAEAKRLINGGARGLMMRAGTPPAGFSPAHSALDPLWAYLADAEIPFLIHVGGENGLFA